MAWLNQLNLSLFQFYPLEIEKRKKSSSDSDLHLRIFWRRLQRWIPAWKARLFFFKNHFQLGQRKREKCTPSSDSDPRNDESHRKSGWNITSSSSSLRIRTTQIPWFYTLYSQLHRIRVLVFRMNFEFEPIQHLCKNEDFIVVGLFCSSVIINLMFLIFFINSLSLENFKFLVLCLRNEILMIIIGSYNQWQFLIINIITNVTEFEKPGYNM